MELLERRLTERLPELLGEVRDLLADGWPDYAEFLDGDTGSVQEGAGLFVHRLLLLATRPPGASDQEASEPGVQSLFEQIGRRQWEVGHDLTRLLTAYQLGARVAWRYVATTADEVDVSREVVGALAEAVFDFVSRLSQASARGFVLAQQEDSRDRDRHRDELVGLLLSERASMEAIRSAAARAKWPLPATAAIVLVDGSGPGVPELMSRLDSYALPVRQVDLTGAVVPDPGGARRALLAQELAGTGAVVGVNVPVGLLGRTLTGARITLRLRSSGVVADDPVFVDDHLDTVIVHRDGGMLTFLGERVLAPLDGLSDGARARLTQTLTAWLVHQGDRAAMAEQLGVHPQTVSYRLGRLRELFGDRLDSPRERLRLLLALGWSQVG
ncbi:helix-turn-helix domain-containing protein [Nocardioides sp. CER19]|uniref:helix-turn-helix domain-containing protein n=1 Tax=Nocardioides sp. CER19 TaxID=3038538 RepID=UPI002446F7F0|nr:helix-turn-helix domain-containing protein [Nocardioides sp. CER19]MDH2414476.1 helix-turn-helix domain-containing protein [Nocardioides sp. CER19]